MKVTCSSCFAALHAVCKFQHPSAAPVKWYCKQLPQLHGQLLLLLLLLLLGVVLTLSSSHSHSVLSAAGGPSRPGTQLFISVVLQAASSSTACCQQQLLGAMQHIAIESLLLSCAVKSAVLAWWLLSMATIL
jgi:hypothetical protein